VLRGEAVRLGFEAGPQDHPRFFFGEVRITQTDPLGYTHDHASSDIGLDLVALSCGLEDH
jgi:hypothetical protein